jgi:SH3-like domain-containing protein
MTLVVIENDVRLRAGPGTDFDILADLDAGALVEATSEHGWRAVVTSDGQYGWVAVEYLRDLDGSEG